MRTASPAVKKLVVFIFALALLVPAALLVTNVERAQAADTNTYIIHVNRTKNCVTVYKKVSSGGYSLPGISGHFKAVKAMICSTGGSNTPLGTFRTKAKYRWKVLMGPSYGQYSTRITGGVLFHSVWYYQMNKATQSTIQYNKLGTGCSHGCVRLTVADAKWIYDYCPVGTRTVITTAGWTHDYAKPTSIKVSTLSRMGWDPTDPDPKNPYLSAHKPYKVTITTAVGKVLSVGSTFRLTYKLYSTQLLGTWGKQVTWSSSNTKVASVSSTGRITARSKGYTIITVRTVNGKTASYRIYVGTPVARIALTASRKTIAVGETLTLKKTIYPTYATNRMVSWASSNTAVATVDSGGIVTARKIGTATITVKAKDGSGKSATFVVTVGYTVTFKNHDGTTLKTQVVASGAAATAPSMSGATYTDSGTGQRYRFTGWSTAFNSVTGNITVTALYEKVLTVTFSRNDPSDTSNYATVEVAEGSTVTQPSDPVSTSGIAVFGGWYTDAGCDEATKYDFTQPVADDVTLYARWIIS